MIPGTVFFLSFCTSLVLVYIYTHNTMKHHEFLHQSSSINSVQPSFGVGDFSVGRQQTTMNQCRFVSKNDQHEEGERKPPRNGLNQGLVLAKT